MDGTQLTAKPAAPPLARLPPALRFLRIAAVAVPLLFLGVTAWHDRSNGLAAAEAEIIRLSAIAREQTLKVIETNLLVLDLIEARIAGMDWPRIRAESQAVHDDLRRLDDRFAQVTNLHLIAPDGVTTVMSIAWPIRPSDVSARDYFRRIADGQALVFSEPFRGNLTGLVTFGIARRRETASGAFDGAVLGSVQPGYFQAQWHDMDPKERLDFALLRTDGQVLAVHPARGDGLFATPDLAAVPAAIREPLEGIPTLERHGERGEWLTAYRKVGEFPLVVAVTLPLDAIRGDWLASLAATAILCLAAALAMASATILAERRWRSEQTLLAELRAEIARRENAEAGLRQSQRLEALGRLTGGVAHDFNNLLTAVLGTVHLLERHLGESADDRVKRLLGVARDAVDRGARLNASLLAFARRQRLHAESVDPNALLRGFAPLIQRALGETVRLELALDTTVEACRADAAQLEAALLNLAINARDAMPAGGRVVVSTRPDTLDAEALGSNTDAQPGAYVAIAIADTGQGMTAEVRERAFEPFFTTKPVGRGTGLGLSQVFGFVRQLGGHLKLDSAPGDGTVVTLFLPAARLARAEAGAKPPPSASCAGHDAAVLVVEDDARVREVAVAALREAGFRVTAAPDGPAALHVLRGPEPVDILFSDIVMPGGLTGIDVAREAQLLRPGLPVLLATGYAGSVMGGDDHGFEVLAKPYDQAAMARRLAALLPRRKPAPADGGSTDP